MDTFDLIATPDRIQPAFVFDVLFLVIGPGLFGLGLVILRHIKRGNSDIDDRVRNFALFLMPFSVIWMIGAAFGCGQDITHAYSIQAMVKRGQYQTLEGCLQNFHAGVVNPGKTTAGDERWSVAERTFSYGDNEVRFAYHIVEPKGGIVHADSWVRVSFVPDDSFGRDDILRLEAKRGACPHAVDRS